METYSLELDFREQTAGVLGPPRAQIYVKCGQIGEFNQQYISPQCVSFGEFNHEILRLIEELKELKRKAKRKFEKQKREEQKRFNETL